MFPRRRTLGENLVNPTGLAVDALSQRLFWTDWGDRSIVSCSLAAPHAAPEKRKIGEGLFGHRMDDGPWGIAVDPATSTVVWSSAGSAAVRRADLDGSNVCILSEGDSTSWSAKGPWGLALHLRPGCASFADRMSSSDVGVKRGGSALRRSSLPPPERGLGRVFWTSWGRIQSCELGTRQVRDVVRGLIDPTGLVIDQREGGRIFWTDAKAGKVQCSALDGSQVCDVVTGLDEPFGLAVGPTHLFWTDRRRGTIQSCCLRTGTVCEVIRGLNAPEGAARRGWSQNPSHEFALLC